MGPLPPDIISFMSHFAPLFSSRVWPHAQVLLTGALLAPGKRTVSALLRVLGLDQHSAKPTIGCSIAACGLRFKIAKFCCVYSSIRLSPKAGGSLVWMIRLSAVEAITLGPRASIVIRYAPAIVISSRPAGYAGSP